MRARARRWLFRLCLALTFAGAVQAVRSSRVHAQPSVEPARETSAADGGFAVALSPALFLPPEGGPLRFAIAGDAQYGFRAGPLLLSPGLRLVLYSPSAAYGLAALATGRITVFPGQFALQASAGLGPCLAPGAEQVRLAYELGTGLLVRVRPAIAVGAAASYVSVRAPQFRALSFGPTLVFYF